MKKSGILLILLMIVLPLSSLAQGGRWVYLGERLVNDRLDNDIIAVTAAKGDFSAVQIRVKGAAIDFHRVVIVYGNGRRQEVELRHTIGAGNASRVIDLAGDDRVIRSIEFWYDAKTLKGRKALVRVFGRR